MIHPGKLHIPPEVLAQKNIVIALMRNAPNSRTPDVDILDPSLIAYSPNLKNSDTHTHTHIYIYCIYIYLEKKRKKNHFSLFELPKELLMRDDLLRR